MLIFRLLCLFFTVALSATTPCKSITIKKESLNERQSDVMSFVLLNNERLRNELENGNSKLLDSLIFEIDGINYETTKQKIKELAQQKQSSYDFAKAIIMEFYK